MIIKCPRDKGKKIKENTVKISSFDIVQLIDTIRVESNFIFNPLVPCVHLTV